jgi:hypothetical protein
MYLAFTIEILVTPFQTLIAYAPNNIDIFDGNIKTAGPLLVLSPTNTLRFNAPKGLTQLWLNHP